MRGKFGILGKVLCIFVLFPKNTNKSTIYCNKVIKLLCYYKQLDTLWVIPLEILTIFWHFIIGFFFSSIYLSKPLFFGIISCYLVYIESELTTDVILNIFLVIIQLIVKFRLNLSTKECCSCLSMTKMLNTGTGVFVIHSNFENGILSLSTTLIVNKLYK